jgi:hypothetical protein
MSVQPSRLSLFSTLQETPGQMFQRSAGLVSVEVAPALGAQPAQFGKPSLTAEVHPQDDCLAHREAPSLLYQQFKLSIPVPVLSGSHFCGGGPCLGMPSLPSSGNEA